MVIFFIFGGCKVEEGLDTQRRWILQMKGIIYLYCSWKTVENSLSCIHLQYGIFCMVVVVIWTIRVEISGCGAGKFGCDRSNEPRASDLSEGYNWRM